MKHKCKWENQVKKIMQCTEEEGQEGANKFDLNIT
jgi:hypothetical protein